MGETVSDVVPKLLKKADYDLELAERGIVFLDNLDRICSSSGGGEDDDAEAREVLREINEFVEGTTVTAPSKKESPLQSQQQKPVDLYTSFDSGIDEEAGDNQSTLPLLTLHTSQLFFICFGVRNLTGGDSHSSEADRRDSAISMAGGNSTNSNSGGSSGKGSRSSASSGRSSSNSRNRSQQSSNKKQQDSLDSGSFYSDEEDDDDSYEVSEARSKENLVRPS